MEKRSLWLAILLGLLIPWILLAGREPKIESSKITTVPSTESTEECSNGMISVLDLSGDIQTMELEAYVLGVLVGEMPESFSGEALKAQAVVARTFALKNKDLGIKHNECAVCMDSSCCQSYYDPLDYCTSGGDITAYIKAVEETAGQVLVYEGELIEATYFSCSGGRTEAAQAVWGSDVPYLQSVESPGEERAEHYMDTIIFSASEFQKKMGQEFDGVPGQWIGQVSYTAGGGVDTIYIGGIPFSGVEVRKKLGLYSSAFVISAVGDRITITTKGFGHRVGMSQYGADAMARKGNSYVEILAYYYPQTDLHFMSNV